MKSYPFRAPFYALVPAIWTEDDELFIRTSFFQYVISLFSDCRIVHISKGRKIVEIKIKKWWRWKSPVRIPFRKIDFIDLNKDNPHKIYELFLVTKDPFSRVNLFRFGSIYSSSQIYQQIAENCAEFTTQFTNIRFGLRNRFEMPSSDFNDKYICTACGHQLHPDSEFILCPYCGGKEIRIEGINENNTETIIWRDSEEKEAKAEVNKRALIKRKRFEPKKSSLRMVKIGGIVTIFGGVVLYLFRHSIPGGFEVAVAGAILWPLLGIVVFLFGMQMEKYFIEISDQGININNKENIVWRDIKEVKMENYKYFLFNLGQSIEIYHFGRNGKKKITSLPGNLQEDEKLYKIIKDHIKSYPDTEMEIEGRWRIRYLSASHIRSYLYVLTLTVGLVIFIIFNYITSPRTLSNKNIPTNSQLTNQFVPKSQAHEAIIEGYNFYKKGDFKNAIAEYTEAIENDPNNNEAYFYRGAAFLKTEEDDKALTDFKRSIELDPHHYESYKNLEWLLAKKGEIDTIIIFWNEFLELEPDHAQAYLNRGRAYYHQGIWDAALKDAKKSCELGNSEGCMRYKQLKEKTGN